MSYNTESCLQALYPAEVRPEETLVSKDMQNSCPPVLVLMNFLISANIERKKNPMLVNDFTHHDQLATSHCLAWRESYTTSCIQENKKTKKKD